MSMPAAARSCRANRGSGSPRYGCRRYATAFSTLRSSPFTRRDGACSNITSKNGSIIKPARSPARWKSLNPVRRYSRPPRVACPISARSRSLARSVTVIFASAKAGATRIRALQHGWTLSMRACRLSRRPSQPENITFTPAARGFIRRADVKKLRCVSTGAAMSRSARRSELVVHARAQEIGVERHVVGGEPAAAIQSAIEATEIDIEILDLGRPVGRERGFQPGADRPTAIVAAGLGEARNRSLDVAERGAAGDIRHETIRGVAEPPAHGCQPRVARLAAGWTQICSRTVDPRPIDIAFDAGDHLTELIIVAGGAADEPAAHIAAAGRIPVRTAEAAAAVDADVKAGPIVDLYDSRLRSIDRPRRPARQIGRRRDHRHCRERDKRKHNTL